MKLVVGFFAALALALVTVSCDSKQDGLGQQLGETVSDTQVLKDAEAAANQIIGNATDCEAVKANISEVNRKLDEVERQVQTATGRTALASLRKQVKSIADSCGAN